MANYAADTAGATNFTNRVAKPVKDTGVMMLGISLSSSRFVMCIGEVHPGGWQRLHL
ncbi:hypothetical protein D3C81_2330090 [compost metagenome]